jgi:PAS domain S-box-containing protein
MAEMKTSNGMPSPRQVKLAKIAYKYQKSIFFGKLNQRIRHPWIMNELRGNELLDVKLCGNPALDALILDSARSDNAHASHNVRIITDDKLNIMHASAGVEQLLGCTQEGMRWDSVENMIKDDATPGFLRFMKLVAKARRPILSAMPVIGCAGNTVWVNGNAAVVRKEDGGLAGYSFSIYDATSDIAQKESTQGRLNEAYNRIIALEKLNETIKKFMSISNHDIRNGVGNIQSFLDLIYEDYLKGGKPFDDDAKAMISVLKNAADSTFNLLETLTKHAKSEISVIGRVPVKFGIGFAIKDAIKSVESSRGQYNAKINFSDSPLSVLAERSTTTLAIRNLLMNAIKYAKGADITVESDGKFAIVRVSDNGPGNQMLDSLFDKIEKNGALNSIGNGVGIGLALSYEFAKKNGGTMRAQNRLNLDGTVAGADFFLYVPLAKE